MSLQQHESAKSVEIVIPSILNMALHWRSRFFGNVWAKKILEKNKGKTETFLPLTSALNSQWKIDKRKLEQYLTKMQIRRESGRSFHGYFPLSGFLRPRTIVNLASRDQVKENIKKLLGQIELVAHLSRDQKSNLPKILILHPGLILLKKSEKRAMENIACILGAVAEKAKEKNVLLSLETMYSEGPHYVIGTEIGELVEIIEKSGCKDQVGITIDLAHSLVAYKGHYNLLEKEIKAAKNHIHYAHVHHPTDKAKYFRSKLDYIKEAPLEDGHTDIIDIPEEKRFNNLVKFLSDSTPISHLTRTIGMEIAWRGLFLPRFWRGGATIKRIYESYEKLEKLITPSKMNDLKKYQEKRYFEETPEPKGKIKTTGKQIFVVHKHQARHLHYDFRLEEEGVLKSWAVPKKIPNAAGIKRLAVQVEDHPVDYAGFEGEIPEGQYGAGKVEIWDKGVWRKIKGGIKEGGMTFSLKGKNLRGNFVLLKTKFGKQKNSWLLFKKK